MVNVPNPLTAERALEIARDSLKRATGFPVESMRAGVIDSIAVDFIDQRIETLEACAKEHCGWCYSSYPLGMFVGDTVFKHLQTGTKCLAQYEQRELTRLRKEREKLTAASTITE